MTPTGPTPKTTTTTIAEESPSAAASRYQELRSHLAELKLAAAAEALPAVLDQASAEGLSLTVALERLLAVEVEASTARRLAGRLRFACLPTPATLDDFDVDAAAGIDRKLIDELGTCRCLESATNILLIGPPGTGENPPQRRGGPSSRLCRLPHVLHHRRGSGRPLPPGRDQRQVGHHYALLRRPDTAGDRRTRLSTITGRGRLGVVQVVSQRYLKTSVVITTNRGVGAWGEILGDTTVAAAMLDRLLHRSVVTTLDTESYRLRDHHAAAETLRRTTTGNRQQLH
ncbi:ATPase AAA [Mycolicibacterium litorale]|uniref:ATPase AAA n=1 Tax=Mycolicibacterium litorale TaxID=758802 RepID=A0A6S6P190_9MYCO|nr:ATPase AAA [Mycolicibacterium litorale]